MDIQIPFVLDLSDYFLVKAKTISRIAIADIMDNDMLIRWYKKVLDSESSLKKLKGFGYFESDFSHGYVMASRRFNRMALDVIKFQFKLRNMDRSSNRNLFKLKLIEESLQ